MGLWPALRRSKRRTSGQRTSTAPFPTLRALSDWDGTCAVPVTAHVFSGTIHHLLGAPWSILGYMTADTRGFWR